MDRETEGFPLTSLREIKILKQLKHENILSVLEVCTSEVKPGTKGNCDTLIVVEFMDHDLAGMIQGVTMSEPQIKCYIKQILNGLHYLHAKWIVHRDLKPANILINNKGIVKLADFGLSRSFKNPAERGLTNRVVTQWYRAPELLLCTEKHQHYGAAVDIWAVGCIVAEMYIKKPLFACPNDNELDQLEYATLKEPRSNAQVKRYANADTFLKSAKPRPRELVTTLKSWKPKVLTEPLFKEQTIKFIDQLLVLDPTVRPSAEVAADHDYFWVEPFPVEPAKIPSLIKNYHEHTTKKAPQEHHSPPQTARHSTGGVHPHPSAVNTIGNSGAGGAGQRPGTAGPPVHSGAHPPHPPASHHQQQQQSYPAARGPSHGPPQSHSHHPSQSHQLHARSGPQSSYSMPSQSGQHPRSYPHQQTQQHSSHQNTQHPQRSSHHPQPHHPSTSQQPSYMQQNYQSHGSQSSSNGSGRAPYPASTRPPTDSYPQTSYSSSSQQQQQQQQQQRPVNGSAPGGLKRPGPGDPQPDNKRSRAE